MFDPEIFIFIVLFIYSGYVLGKSFSGGIEDLGPIRWKLVVALAVAWVIVCAALINGVKSSGKVSLF